MIYIDSDSTILDEVERTVKCNFDGLVVMDSYGNTYNAVANWNYTHSREGGAGFIQPFFSRFPIAIYNGNVNYESGNASGLLLPFDSKGNPVYDNLTLYRHRLIDYITDHRVSCSKLMMDICGWWQSTTVCRMHMTDIWIQKLLALIGERFKKFRQRI